VRLSSLLFSSAKLKSFNKHQKSEDFCGLKISVEIFKLLKKIEKQKIEQRINKKMRKIKINRKAWLRILEAFLAVIIVLSAVLTIIAKQKPKTDISEEVYEKQRQVLDIISKNNDLRNDILMQDNTRINNIISNLIPGNWNYSTNICNISLICHNPKQVHETEVYTTEIIITSNLTKYAPKKLRFFVWAK